MSALTQRQKNELNSAILEYLMTQGPAFAASADNFKRECGISSFSPLGSFPLEKKWVTVTSLEQSISDLEEKAKQLEEYAASLPKR